MFYSPLTSCVPSTAAGFDGSTGVGTSVMIEIKIILLYGDTYCLLPTLWPSRVLRKEPDRAQELRWPKAWSKGVYQVTLIKGRRVRDIIVSLL